MKKEAIIHSLSTGHRAFVDFIKTLSKEEFEFSKNEKWTPGQQLEHLYLSIRPLEKILHSIDVLTQFNFGKSNGTSKEYTVLTHYYRTVLEAGAKATAPFLPKIVHYEALQELTKKLATTIESLCRNLEKFTEQELDDYFIPHPLLKNLTIREMLYFTMCHVAHHHKRTIANLNRA